MQESRTIARPYANAAFEFAVEHNVLEEWSSALQLLSAMTSDPVMQSVLSDPKITDNKLLDLINSVGGESFKSREISNFIKLLIKNERLQFAPEMTKLFEDLFAQKKSVVSVEVISARDLTPEEADKIASAMQARLGVSIEISASVDENLIGGAIIRAGDMVIDTSLRGRLQKLANNFI